MFAQNADKEGLQELIDHRIRFLYSQKIVEEIKEVLLNKFEKILKKSIHDIKILSPHFYDKYKIFDD